MMSINFQTHETKHKIVVLRIDSEHSRVEVL